MYADDLKLFKRINSADDHLQQDIDNLYEWSLFNRLDFNVMKCVSTSFGTTKYVNVYNLAGFNLNSVLAVNDLGVEFDTKLTFKNHITAKVKKSQQILSFVLRFSKTLKSIETCKLLYQSLVRSQLEYGSIIWNPQQIKYKTLIERVQKRFLRYMYFRTNHVYPNFRTHPVSSIEMERKFKLTSLKVRREIAYCLFIHKVLNNRIDCALLLSLLLIRVKNKNTRSSELFIYDGRSNSPLNRAMLILNKLPPELDVFFISFNGFKKMLHNQI